MKNSVSSSESDTSIFQAGVNDIPSIRDMAWKTWPVTYKDVIPPGQIEYMLELMYSKDALVRQMQEGHIFFIAKRNESAHGFASVGPIDEGVYKLHKLYVLPEHQGTGLGKNLLQKTMHYASGKGATRLILQVNKKNRSREFYVSQGFKVEEEAVFPIGEGYVMDDYVMAISLV
jgi:diamine N-acetyltransferase